MILIVTNKLYWHLGLGLAMLVLFTWLSIVRWRRRTSTATKPQLVAALIGVVLLGERQKKNYLPRGLLGLMVMSYLGSVGERSSRMLSRFISAFGTMTPVG